MTKVPLPESESIVLAPENDSKFLTALAIFLINGALTYGLLYYLSDNVFDLKQWGECTYALVPIGVAVIINMVITHIAHKEFKKDKNFSSSVTENIVNYYQKSQNLLSLGILLGVVAGISHYCNKNPNLNMNDVNKKSVPAKKLETNTE